MDREETKKLLKILSTAYPKYFSGMSKEGKLDQIELYEAMFGQYPADIVVYALYDYIKHNEYPPSIAGLQKHIDRLNPDNDVQALWIELSKACRKGTRLTRDDFENLPEPIRKWAGDVAQIRELALMSSETFNTVIRGQFTKAMKDISERHTDLPKIEQSYYKMIEQKDVKE